MKMLVREARVRYGKRTLPFAPEDDLQLAASEVANEVVPDNARALLKLAFVDLKLMDREVVVQLDEGIEPVTPKTVLYYSVYEAIKEDLLHYWDTARAV
jgi:hypothetical protein